MLDPWTIVLISLFPLDLWAIEYNLHQTRDIDGSDSYYHCLYYKVLNETVLDNALEKDFRHAYLLIPYCLRPSEEDENPTISQGSIAHETTLEDLKARNTSVDDLFRWSAPVDLVEDYQYYLETLNSSLASLTFNNCSATWFGPRCQYQFQQQGTFQAIVYRSFLSKSQDDRDHDRLICSIHLPCSRGSFLICLDWREICNGRVDCEETGIDEMNCFQLELDRCAEDQYRCSNGQCIPREFLNDDPYNPDCLDATDEDQFHQVSYQWARMAQCYRDPSFRCEETAYYQRPASFVCGDGQVDHLFIRIASRCANRRDELLHEVIWQRASSSYHLSSSCWSFVHCLTFKPAHLGCQRLCEHSTSRCSISIGSRCDPKKDAVIFPLLFLLPSDVRVGYWTNQTIVFNIFEDLVTPNFTCYDADRCPSLPANFSRDHLTCFHNENIDLTELIRFFHSCRSVDRLHKASDCAHSSLYSCPKSSKCISKHRLLDGIIDCPGGADERYPDSAQLDPTARFSCTSEKKWLSRAALRDGIAQCLGGEDERSHIHQLGVFAKLCNGNPYLLDEENGTDETNCTEWPCNNLYTRCDGMWTCPDGADELDCDPQLPCYPGGHECISPVTYEVICLPVNRTGDGHVDCIGGTDERQFCREEFAQRRDRRYRCWNESLCVPPGDPGDTVRECRFDRIEKILDGRGGLVIEMLWTDVRHADEELTKPVYFKLHSSTFYSYEIQITPPERVLLRSPLRKRSEASWAWFCHRGVLVHIGLNRTARCLCSPSYFGLRCQFQSQRVSVTLQLDKECAGSCREIYAFVLRLLDDDSVVHSSEQFSYITTFNCDWKHNFYLHYRSAEKDLTKNFTVRLDAFEKRNLSYVASWSFAIVNLFLPVNRLSVHLTIPSHSPKTCPLHCGAHGHCAMFVNQGRSFCRCHSGWVGANCTVREGRCQCSFDSLCLGLVGRQSICVCPRSKTGPRCFLRSICTAETCHNGGECLPEDYRVSRETFLCLCPLGYSGTICEIRDTRLEIAFEQSPIPQSFFLHLITVQPESDPLITTISKKIPFDQQTSVVFTSMLFNLLFIQIEGEFSLSFLQINASRADQLKLIVRNSDRCAPIDRWDDGPLLHRVKSYSSICRRRADRRCLSDNEAYLCLCDEHRFANCFRFPFEKNSRCPGRTHCENGGQCLQDLPRCPSSTMCICPQCYYGSRCQFTTKGFQLSLDVILGYRISPHRSLSEQSSAVRFSLAVTMVMSVIGLLSSFCSMLVFRSRTTREVGCGLYLFALAINSLLCILVFTLRFWLLVLSQVSVINCTLMEYLLRSLPTIGDWFSACVAIERAYMVLRGINFNPHRSQKVARWVILTTIVATLASLVHDPIYRRLIDDEEEQRSWCVVHFPSPVQRYHSAINVVHFLLPFLINFVSALIIIGNVARRHSSIRQQKTYHQHLRGQFREKKHLILSPIILVLLAVPRLVLSFLTGCMQSNQDPSLFLLGYFISFIPPFFASMVYILTSKAYQQELSTILHRTLIRLFTRTLPA